MKRLAHVFGRDMYGGVYRYFLIGLAIVIAGLLLCPGSAYAAQTGYGIGNVRTSYDNWVIDVERRVVGSIFVEFGYVASGASGRGYTYEFFPDRKEVVLKNSEGVSTTKESEDHDGYISYLRGMRGLVVQAQTYQENAADRQWMQGIVNELTVAMYGESSGGIVKGTAYDQSSGVRLADVNIRIRNVWPLSGTQAYTGSSNADGYYEVRGIATSVEYEDEEVLVTYKVMASLKGYKDYEGGEFSFSGGKNEIVHNVYLVPNLAVKGTVSGRVYDKATNKSLAGVTVTLEPQVTGYGTRDYTTTTNSSGNYLFSDVTRYVQSSGGRTTWISYMVNIQEDGYEDYISGWLAFSPTVIDITHNAALTPEGEPPIIAGTVKGTVFDEETGRPLADASVILMGKSELRTTSDSEGNYEFSPVARYDIAEDVWMEYDIYAAREGYEGYMTVEPLAFSENILEITHDIELIPLDAPETGTIKGKVTDRETGDPLVDATVVLIGGGEQVTATNERGDYAFTDLDRGNEVSGWKSYNLAVGAARHESYYTEQPLQFSEDVTVITHNVQLIKIELPPPEPGTISGRVTDANTGEAVERATVILIGAIESRTMTDPDGNYEFDDVERGYVNDDDTISWLSYHLAVERNGYEDYHTENPLEFSENVMVITHSVTLTPLEPIDGTIGGVVYSHIRDHAEPFAGATVKITSSDGTFESETITNSKGEYLFNVYRYHLADDGRKIYNSYNLHIVEEYHDEFHSGGLAFSAGKYEIRYDVIVKYKWWGPGTISGHVYDASTNKAISGATVTASAAGRGGTVTYTARTNRDGYYEMTGVTRYGQSSGGAVTYLSYTVTAKARRYRNFKGASFRFSEKVHDITYDIGMSSGYRRASVDINSSGDDEAVFASIQEAIDNVDDNGIIAIKPAVYMESIDIGRPITLAAEMTASGEMPEIRGNGSIASIYVHDTDGTVKIAGLKITNGGTGYVNSDYTSGGIYATRVDNVIVEANVISDNLGSGVCLGEGVGAATIANNVLTDNTATWTAGGGISITNRGENAQYRILNNLIADNSGQVSGGIYAAVLVSDPSATLEVVNNTIAYNVSEKSVYGGGMLAISNPALKLKNNIIYGNTVKVGASSALRKNLYLFSALSMNDGMDFDKITYNDIEGLASAYGTGERFGNNIDVDPIFVSRGDLHLSSQSPCIDAGDPLDDCSNEPQPNGGRVNMGAYGNTAEATTSLLADDEVENKPPEITFAKKLSNFMIYWKGNDEEDGSSLVYSYRVDGGRWTTWDKRYFLIIRRLQGSIGGSQHTFEIKAKDSDGAESLSKSLVF